MNRYEQAIANITFSPAFGEFGLHDGFFNAATSIDGEVFYFQCCAEGALDARDCGHDWGISGDCNEPLARALAHEDGDLSDGYEAVRQLLVKAWELFNS